MEGDKNKVFYGDGLKHTKERNCLNCIHAIFNCPEDYQLLSWLTSLNIIKQFFFVLVVFYGSQVWLQYILKQPANAHVISLPLGLTTRGIVKSVQQT